MQVNLEAIHCMTVCLEKEEEKNVTLTSHDILTDHSLIPHLEGLDCLSITAIFTYLF